MTNSKTRDCGTCRFEFDAFKSCWDKGCFDGGFPAWEPKEAPGIGHNGGSALEEERPIEGTATVTDPSRQVHLPEDQEERNQMLLFEGFMAYFPNAMAEVAKLSYAATKQHHPDQPMHWDRSKSTDHPNKIARHLIDSGKIDDKGQRHSAALAWRAMAHLQEELERDLQLPPSPASKNRPW